MKKLFTAVVVAGALASTAMATVGIDFGTNWYKVNYTDNSGDHMLGQGQNFLVTWTLDNDLSLGSYAEAGTWIYNGGSTDDWDLTAIQIAKGIVKNVAIGTNIGRMYNTYGGSAGMLTDVFGSVVVIGGSGDKVNGSLKAIVSARFTHDNSDTFNGLNLNLVVGLMF